MTGSTSPSPSRRPLELPERLFDFGVVVTLLLVGVAIVAASPSGIQRVTSAQVRWHLWLVLPLAALLLRRRHPLVTLGVVLVSLAVEAFLRSPILLEPLLLVAVYTVAAIIDWRRSLPAAGATVAVLLATSAVPGGALTLHELVTALVAVGAAYVVGIYAGTRAAHIEALRARAAHLDRERELLAQRAVAEERVRIARELHDVVGHYLSLITVQAGALQTQLDPADPASRTVRTMARTGRQALDEMRSLLGVLRLGSVEAPGHAPQPVLDELPTLIAQARAAGLPVELCVEGDRRPLPAGVDVCAYRIVQEALTNVMRHARPTRCEVLVRYGRATIELRVTDDGGGGSVEAPVKPGHGLIGMRERAALFGGDLDAGPRQGGGFAVRATLRLHGSAVEA
jgi:signal transduction histidine kinase